MIALDILTATKILVQEDRFRDLPHRLPPLTALALHTAIGLIFRQVEGPLEDAFCAI
jgi:hypothetical protein